MLHYLLFAFAGLLSLASYPADAPLGKKGPMVDPDGFEKGPMVDPSGLEKGPMVDPNGLSKGPMVDPNGAP